MERWMTYGELDLLSAALGAWLQSKGLEPDARVAIMLPNVPQFPVTMSGILRAGFTCVNVNPLYTARELEHQLKDSGATAIVILENFASVLTDVIDKTPIKHVVVASMGDLLGFWYGKWITFAVRHLARMVPEYKFNLANGLTVTSFNQAINEGKSKSFKSAASSLDSIAFLQYTGGTTGVSKGAVLTHRNIGGDSAGRSLVYAGPGSDWRYPQEQQHCGLAAVSHLCADLVTAGDPMGIVSDLDSQPKGFWRFRCHAQNATVSFAASSKHAFQRFASATTVQERRFLQSLCVAGWRHGRFGGYRQALA
jgi:acyl-CoA synthetase (AMP-forming)/AMP-acid ligase II